MKWTRSFRLAAQERDPDSSDKKILSRYHFPVKRSMSHWRRSLRYFLFPQWILRAIVIELARGCERTRAKWPLRAGVWRWCCRRGNLDTGDAISSQCWLKLKYLQRQIHFLETSEAAVAELLFSLLGLSRSNSLNYTQYTMDLQREPPELTCFFFNAAHLLILLFRF